MKLAKQGGNFENSTATNMHNLITWGYGVNIVNILFW